MAPRLALLAIALMTGLLSAPANADERLDRAFREVVRPFLNEYCLTCHGPTKQEGKLDLGGFSTVESIVKGHRTWEIVLDRLEAEDMPPEKAKRKPTDAERQAVIDWVKALRDEEARKNAGDPGPVRARRLSNAEFDRTIRDLTGVDIRPTREFPVDPANEAGFDNSGESLAMSPALVKKYLAAAKVVADHLVLTPEGLEFAPHPAVTDSDRDKYCVKRIVDFYERHAVDYADYFLAAWRFRHRAALGKPDASLADFAREAGLSRPYLSAIWSLLTDGTAFGPIEDLRALWDELPSDVGRADEARRSCERMRDRVIRWRRAFVPPIQAARVNGVSDWSQPFVLWKNRQAASRRMSYLGGGVVAGGQEVAKPRVSLPEGDPNRPNYEAAFARFCRVFPDAFVVIDRSPYTSPDGAGKSRPLSAGFHLMQGYFRDDEPLRELVLDDAGRREIDALWRELNFVTRAPMRQYKDFIFFERAEPPRFAFGPEFDFARSEDRDATSEAKIARMRDAYLAKARSAGASGDALRSMETFFANISAEIRRVERERSEAEPRHLDALATLAARAYRRPLTQAERDDLRATYRELREKDGLDHEDAIRDAFVVVLLSPRFLYLSEPAGPGAEARPLSDYALASRLSYFLWASMPDDELLAHAAAGDLHEPAVLIAQTRRMLRDDRVRGLAEEFAGNWLDIRRFEEHNGVDRERFPAFTNELRRAMYEEPIRFVVAMAREDRPVLDLLDGDYTFVNPVLARHYGMRLPPVEPEDWVRVENARRYGRGGILPMAAFLTKNSPGLRTSPVKRGYWVVRRVLGEQIPPPPPAVPELPRDEAATGDLTLPQLLARHRDDKSCAGCHRRFDSVGLVFEGFGPTGERRDRDLGGRPVSAKATFPDGREGEGLDGLRRYLAERRREDFLDNLSGKLFAYALGRTLIPSDEPTLKAMREKLASDGHRFGSLVESIVTSPQFLNRRGRDDPREG